MIITAKIITLVLYYSFFVKDILPPDDQLELMIKNKQVKSTIPEQKQIFGLVLNSLQNNIPINEDQLLKRKK